MIKKRIPGSFVSVDVTRRTRRSKFLQPIDTLIDWSFFAKELHKVCKRSIQDAAGRPAYSLLVLFKMMLLQIWYNLSDMGVEDMVNEHLASNAFCGLRVEDTVPDHSTLSRFRSELAEKKAMSRLLAKLNAQLAHQGVWVQQGSILDASITPTAYKPDGKPTYKLPEHPDTPPPKEVKPGVDQEAAWVKKGSKLQYGYKRHYLASEETGLVIAVHTTSAHVHDGQCIEACLAQVALPRGSRLLAEKGYCFGQERAASTAKRLTERYPAQGC